MKRIIIFCTTIKYLKLLEKLPEYIVPVGLGDAEYPKRWQVEKNGKNISNINKYFAEFSMFYWMWKNKIKDIMHVLMQQWIMLILQKVLIIYKKHKLKLNI